MRTIVNFLSSVKARLLSALNRAILALRKAIMGYVVRSLKQTLIRDTQYALYSVSPILMPVLSIVAYIALFEAILYAWYTLVFLAYGYLVIPFILYMLFFTLVFYCSAKAYEYLKMLGFSFRIRHQII